MSVALKGARVVVPRSERGGEAAVSETSAGALAEAARRGGAAAVELIGFPSGIGRALEGRFDVALLGLHGDGEGGSAQGFFESAQIPYTGSGVLASALCMDKVRAKAVLRGAGVAVAPELALSGADLEDRSILERLRAFAPRGVVLKPSDAGSSVGVTLTRPGADLARPVREAAALVRSGGAGAYMAEPIVEGPEYGVAFLGGRALGAIRIAPSAAFYDFEAKYRSPSTVYEPVEGEQADRLCALAARAWRALGCRGAGRVDLLGGGEGGAIVMEINTLPGMTPTSLVPKIAARLGWSFDELVARMVAEATTDAAVKRGEA